MKKSPEQNKNISQPIKRKVLCVGNASYDFTIPVDNYPFENIKYRIKEKYECGGGPASNAAYLLGKWGIETYFMGALGDDIYGRKIINEFKMVNVNTEYAELNKECETTKSFIIVSKDNGSRTSLAYRDPKLMLHNNKINFTPDLILFDGQEYDAAINLLASYPKAVTVLDAGRATEQIIDLGTKVNYLVCSQNFAEEVSGSIIDINNPTTAVNVYEKLKVKFPKQMIIVTLEEKGCLYVNNNKINIMPSISVKAVDTTGAGDIFHGAFVYGLIKGFPVEKILKIANITGALSVTKMGGRNSIFPLNKVMEVYEKSV